MNNYLAKPVRAQTLKALLESYLDKDNQSKDIPDLASEAKSIVKQALNETNTADRGGDGGAEGSKGADRYIEDLQIRNRPPSIRKVTAQRIRPKSDKPPEPPA